MAELGPERLASTGSARVLAPYGGACLSCVKNKTRCATSSTSGKCERCLRLNKDCQPAPTVRRRRMSKKPISAVAAVATKTATLEEKLDGIVQLLQLSHVNQSRSSISSSGEDINQSRHQTPDGDFACSILNNRIIPSNNQDFLLKDPRNGEHHKGSPTPLTSCKSTATGANLPFRPTNSPYYSVLTDYPPESEEECEEYLETYRSKMVPYLPIVCIKPEVTVKELREQRPFLWLVIRAICSKIAARQKALGLEVKNTLAREMLFQGTKNLDLLLGVLVFAGWGHYFVAPNPIVTTIIQLGISLASDLGLTKPVPVEPVGVMLNYSAQGCPKQAPTTLQPRCKTMEERRAIIGLYLVSSVTANFFQRIEPMCWTPYLDECLHALKEHRDCPTDELLFYLVRVQLICDRVATVACTDTSPISYRGSRLSQDFYVHTFTAQLEELKRYIPPELKSNVTLQLHILNVVVSIHESSLSVSSSSKDASLDPTTPLQRVESLWICFTAAKSCLDTVFSDSFPTSAYAHISTAIFAHMAHCMVAICRLNTFESPGIPWDRQRTLRELNLGDVVRTWIRRWDGIPDAVGLDTNISTETDDIIWSYTRRTLLVVLNWWEENIVPKLGMDAMKPGDEGIEKITPMNIFNAPHQSQMDAMDVNVDILDDGWMRDMLGGGYDYFRNPYF